MMRKHVSLLAGFCLTFVLAALPAQAAPILDFGTGSAGIGGTINYDSSRGTLLGSGIRIGALNTYQLPTNNGEYDVTGNTVGYGVLDFETGAYQGFYGGAHRFAGGGYFTIHGNVLAAGVNCPSVPGPECSDPNPGPGSAEGALLLSGIFTAAFVSNTIVFSSQSYVIAGGTDVKNDKLENFFGLASDTPYIFNGFVVQTSGAIPMDISSGFTRTATSTDIVNEVIPEPASLLLLGSGLTVLGTVIRKRKKNTKA